MGGIRSQHTLFLALLNRKLKEGILSTCPKVIVFEEPEVADSMLGHPAYPLMAFIQKEYAKQGQTLEEQFC